MLVLVLVLFDPALDGVANDPDLAPAYLHPRDWVPTVPRRVSRELSSALRSPSRRSRPQHRDGAGSSVHRMGSPRCSSATPLATGPFDVAIGSVEPALVTGGFEHGAG